MRRTRSTTGGSVVGSLLCHCLLQRREGDTRNKSYFCTPNTQSLLAETLRGMGISSTTAESPSQIVPCWALQLDMKKCLPRAPVAARAPPAPAASPTHTGTAPGEGGEATTWELLQVLEGPSPRLLQAQSASRTTAKAARCSLPPSPSPQVLRHFVFLFQNLFLLVCKDGEVLF